MGDKAQAKRRMLAAGVPCAPGYLGDAQDDATFTAEAGRLGFPLLVTRPMHRLLQRIEQIADGDGDLRARVLYPLMVNDLPCN